MSLGSPWTCLAAAVLVLPTLTWHFWLRPSRRRSAVRFPGVGELARLPAPATVRLRHLVPALRWMALALAIVALGRPRLDHKIEEVLTRGIDIVVALDVSGSMLAEDFEPKNRMEGARAVVRQFVAGRLSDRIGLVVFAGRAYTQCPLTLDRDVLLQLLDRVQVGMLPEDGTAIGMGLSTALNRLRETGAKSRVVILVTDGRNNAGKIPPQTAAELARSLGIKVYTIGIGGTGRARVPYLDPRTGRVQRNPLTGQPLYGYTEEDLNEEDLKAIAEASGGRFYRATATRALEAVFEEIDQLEASDIKSRVHYQYTELFPWFLLPALLLLTVEVALASTRLRRVP